MTRQVSEVAIHYRNSSIVYADRKHNLALASHSLRSGDRMPDVQYTDDHGERHRLYQRLQVTQHTIFVFAADQEIMDNLRRHLEAWHCLEAFVLYAVQTTKADAGGGGCHQSVVDPEGAIAKRCAISRGGILIIRPDGYVGYLSDTVNVSRVKAYVRRVLAI